MWPFNKKQVSSKNPKEELVPKRYVEFRKEIHEIGRTLIKYTFLDGRKFNSWVYGSASQYVDIGRVIAVPFYIDSSIFIARSIIRTNYGNKINKVDDEKNPTKSIFGEIIASEIGKTESYQEEFGVAYVVDRLA